MDGALQQHLRRPFKLQRPHSEPNLVHCLHPKSSPFHCPVPDRSLADLHAIIAAGLRQGLMPSCAGDDTSDSSLELSPPHSPCRPQDNGFTVESDLSASSATVALKPARLPSGAGAAHPCASASAWLRARSPREAGQARDGRDASLSDVKTCIQSTFANLRAASFSTRSAYNSSSASTCAPPPLPRRSPRLSKLARTASVMFVACTPVPDGSLPGGCLGQEDHVFGSDCACSQDACAACGAVGQPGVGRAAAALRTAASHPTFWAAVDETIAQRLEGSKCRRQKASASRSQQCFPQVAAAAAAAAAAGAAGRCDRCRAGGEDAVVRIDAVSSMHEMDDDFSNAGCGGASLAEWQAPSRDSAPLDPEFECAKAAGTLAQLLETGKHARRELDEAGAAEGPPWQGDGAAAEAGREGGLLSWAPVELQIAPVPADLDFDSELNLRMSRARQTMEYLKWQSERFGGLRIAALSVWDALALLTEVPRVARDVPGQSPQDSAYACADWCMTEFPGHPWMPLVGLLHDLGRLLTHPRFGAEPGWSVVSEAYPLGCAFSDAISGHQYLFPCPDRRCSAYGSPTGIYSPGCGLANVHFTWTGTEYLHAVLRGNRVPLPAEALDVLRYQNFEAYTQRGAYGALLSERDRAGLPLLRRFARVVARVRAGEPPPGGHGRGAIVLHCHGLLARYMPGPVLHW